MTDQAARPTMNLTDVVRDNWGWFLALGVIFIVGGVFAFLSPFIASLVVTVIVAAVMVVTGIIQIIQSWRMQSWGGFLLHLLVGIVLVIGGIAIYFNPVAGTLALTLFASAAFIVKGVFQIILGFRVRPNDGWGWIVAAGVIAILVGLMIYLDWPFSGIYALGILAGVSLAFTGATYVTLALAGRRLTG